MKYLGALYYWILVTLGIGTVYRYDKCGLGFWEGRKRAYKSIYLDFIVKE